MCSHLVEESNICALVFLCTLHRGLTWCGGTCYAALDPELVYDVLCAQVKWQAGSGVRVACSSGEGSAGHQ
jgi:hypothetical protein